MKSGKRVMGVMIAIAAGSLVYPIAAQQIPPSPQSTTGEAGQPIAPNQPASPVRPQSPAVPRRIPAPTVPGAASPQGLPTAQTQQPPVQPGGDAPLAASPQQSAPGPESGPAPILPGRRALPSPGIASAGMVSLNFNRADLVEIIHIIAQQLRLTYTIDPEVKGTVTINSAEPLRPEDLLPIFHQLLRMNGAVAVRTGNLYHIMPIKDGKGLARPAGQSKEDSFALQIIPVRFFSVAEMKKVLTPFLQPGAEVVENPRGNFLMVMDLPSNIQRLMEIADLIDVQVFAGTRMEIYQPKVASAEELAQEMTKVMQSFASSVPQADNFTAQFIALPRINQLLVISHSEAAWTYARRWLDRIDVIAEGPGRRIFIYPVENGKATELADVLSQALGQPSTGRRDTSRTLQDFHRSSAGASNPSAGAVNPTGSTGRTGSSFGQQSQPYFGSANAAIAVPTPGQVPPAPTVTPQPSAPAAPGIARPGAQPPQPTQQEQLRIVPDPATNSLIIYGTAQEFQNIKNILKELDAAPRQVLLEALILQIDLKDTEDLGVDYEIFRKSRQTIFGKTFGSSAAITTLGKLFPGAPGFSGVNGLSGIVGDNTVSAMIRAAATDSRIKLISSPSVLASDNRPARIQVGSEEPIPTGTLQAATGSTAALSTSTTIQYRNTGRILTIIPQVNSQGLVNLQIKAEVSARGDDVKVGQDTFPAFNTQDAETTAVVQDGETLVIGGLIGERKSKGRSGIPYLMDIPVIGRFFGTTSDSNDRTELIMLITPRVIRNRDEGRFATAEFKSKLAIVRNELERMERDRARSQLPAPPPPMPDPNQYYQGEPPQPAPSKAPVGPRSATAPFAGIVIAPLNETVARAAAVPANPANENEKAPLSEQAVAQASIPQAPERRSENSAPVQTAYALSVVNRNVERPIVPAPRTPSLLSRVLPSRLWAVQVASVNEQKDAERLAGQLRKDGYDAYVVAVDLASKRWYRVRVGQMENLKDAAELKSRLASGKSFKDAYIALR